MDRLLSEPVEKFQLAAVGHQLSVSTNDNGDDDIFIANDDQQAHIRRRAPTRHSIKSLTGRKPASKKSLTTEVNYSFFFIYSSFNIISSRLM